MAGDPDLLERRAGNLIDNAIRYNRGDRGWVIVTVLSDNGCGTVIRRELWTCDPGVGCRRHIRAVPPPALRRPDQTDVRESPGGQGAGLGLSIVRSIATAHHGDVRGVARPDGGLYRHAYRANGLVVVAGLR